MFWLRSIPRRGACRAICAVLLLPMFASPARGDEHAAYPHRPIRLVAAQEPGSATDKIARVVAEALSEHLGGPVVVENRPGAGGSIGAEAVSRAAPDGYTLLLAGYSNLVVTPALRPDVRYDPLRDFAPIGRVAHVPFVFAVRADAPARSLVELVAVAKAVLGKLTYGSLGGGVTGMCMARFLEVTGVDMLAVEYKGASSAITDLVAGRIDFLCNEIGALSAQAQAGRIRLLALPGPRRLAIAAGVPTVVEAGLPEVRVAPWYGVVAPADTPATLVARLAAALDVSVKSETFRRRVETMGYEVIDDTPSAYARTLREEVEGVRRTLSRTRSAAK